MEAAVGVVGNEIGVVELIGVYVKKADTDVLRYFFSSFEDMLRLDGSCADTGKDVFPAECIGGCLQEKGAVNAAGIRDDHLFKGGQDGFESFIFCLDTHKYDLLTVCVSY